MRESWQPLGAVSPGGTVLAIAGDSEGRAWLATRAGLFFEKRGRWEPVLGSLFPTTNVVACADGVLLVSGAGQGIARSCNSGKTWEPCWVDQVEAPVTCFAVSPQFAQDGVLLAGTNGAGILRSSDSGWRWKLCNVGLQEFSILALACAPEWQRRQVVFAATEGGVYRSSGGGRAWRRAGLEGIAVQTLTVSPVFDRDGIVFAGSEKNGLFRSTDKGRSWERFGQRLMVEGELASINCLWCSPDFASKPVMLAGTSSGVIFRSEDGGQSWSCVLSDVPPILSLAEVDGKLYAGLYDQGVLWSEDAGLTWTREAELVARGITCLLAVAGQALFAFGPLEGVWCSGDRGQSWHPISELQRHVPLLTFAAAPSTDGNPFMLAASADGLLCSTGMNQEWNFVLSSPAAAVAFSPDFAADGKVWVGLETDEVVVSADGGNNWALVKTPWRAVPVIALEVSPQFADDRTLVAATFDPRAKEVRIWRSTSGGEQWEPWTKEPTSWPGVKMDLAGRAADSTCLSVGGVLLQHVPGGWQRIPIPEGEAPFVGMIRLPNSSTIVAATASGLLRSGNDCVWSSFDQGLEGQMIIDLALSPWYREDRTLFGLGVGGQIWRRDA